MTLYQYMLKKIPLFNPKNVQMEIETFLLETDECEDKDYSLFIHMMDMDKCKIAVKKLNDIKHIECLLFYKELFKFIFESSPHARQFENLSHLDPLDRVFFIKHYCKINLANRSTVLPNSSYPDWNGDYYLISLDHSPKDRLDFLRADLGFRISLIIYDTLNRWVHYSDNNLEGLTKSLVNTPKTTKTKLSFDLNDVLLPIATLHMGRILSSLQLPDVKFYLKKKPGVTGVSFFEALRKCSYMSEGLHHGADVYHAIWIGLHPNLKLTQDAFKPGKLDFFQPLVEIIKNHLPKITTY